MDLLLHSHNVVGLISAVRPCRWMEWHAAKIPFDWPTAPTERCVELIVWSKPPAPVPSDMMATQQKGQRCHLSQPL